MGRRGVAGGGQYHVRLWRMGMAAGTASSGNCGAHGLTGAGFRHGRIDLVSGRTLAKLEVAGGCPRHGRIGIKPFMAAICSTSFENRIDRTRSGLFAGADGDDIVKPAIAAIPTFEFCDDCQ